MSPAPAVNDNFPALRIRPMESREVELAIEWAAAEGWNPGLHDAECFHAADPEGFLLAELDGEPVGCISAVRYGIAYGFLGLYIMRPEYRGKGYGMALWKEAIRRLEGRNIGLDGVVAQQDNYRKSGFQLAHRNVRYERVTLPVSGPADSPPSLPPGISVLPLDSLPFPQLAEYDTQLFAFPREAFLRCWISRPGHHTAGLLEDGRLTGYGVLRPCGQGHKIGPLFADQESGAELLFQRLAATADGPLYLDVPQVNEAAVLLAERHGMTPVFETARMYTGGDPGLPLPRIYGITTFELG